MIGNALDELGRGEEAVKIYKSAVKQNPRVGLLHYNLSISLRRAGKQREAKAAVENALRYEPNHASSHLTLAAIYQDMGYLIPAILAYSRFLQLEPESPRGIQVLPVLQGLLTGGVTTGKGPNQIQILLSSPSKSQMDEGDFGPVEMMMSMLVAADVMVKPAAAKGKPTSAFERLVSLYSGIGDSLGNSKPNGGFAAKYYAPYFAALPKSGYVEAFVAQTWEAGKIEGASDWIRTNEEKLETFRNWSRTYQWPVK